jgi:hypothetical protein
MAGVLDDWFGVDPKNKYNPWLAAMAANEAAAKKAAADAAAAAPPAAPIQAPVAAPAAPAAPAGPAFDPTPFQGIVDTGFSQFTPDFYANAYKSVYDPYKTGVDSQYGIAKDYLTAGLAKKGQQNSSLGKGLFQQLDALKGQEYTKGQTAAQGYQGGLETGVAGAKKSLYDSIAAGADNAGIGARTKAAADPLYASKPPASTLGQDVFGSIVEPYATAKSPGGPSNPSDLAFATGGNLNLAGGGGGPEASAKVVATPTKKKKT